MNGIFITSGGQTAIEKAYDQSVRSALADKINFLDYISDPETMEERKEDLKNVHFIFSTWGMFPLNKDQIQKYFPNLKAVFYAAGSVQQFARPFLECGVRIFSAFAANGVPVAEYTISQILLAGKGYFQSERLYKTKGHQEAVKIKQLMPGNYGEKVGIIGAGMIGKLVISMLKNFNYNILVFDPFLPDDKADDLGVRKCDLKTIFEECLIISNHLANNEHTKGMITYEYFNLMRHNATFINTGRGAQLIELDLVRALKEVPNRTAVLDVTFPEPVQAGHPFYEMHNVFLTPHIAGSIGDEVARMGLYMLQEYEAFSSNQTCKYEINEDMLSTMA